MDILSFNWPFVLLLINIFLIKGTHEVDYQKIIEQLDENGLISDKIKNEIKNSVGNLEGFTTHGCPFKQGTAHGISKQSLDNHQAAEHVLTVFSDLAKRYGKDEALGRIKRSLNFAELNCLDGWTPCTSDSPYRTIDGRCNNLDHQTWGSSILPNLRYLEPAYEDGLGAPRKYSVTGNCLPSTRQVSKQIHLASPSEHMKMSPKHTHMLMLWGQFVDHDITMTPQRDSKTSCCTYDGFWRNSTRWCTPKTPQSVLRDSLRTAMKSKVSGQSRSKETIEMDRYSDETCMAIELPPGDDQFGVGHQCINFQRSVAVPNGQCDLGYRNQLNQVTAYIDGSAIYGSTIAVEYDLRTQINGFMKTFSGHFLPAETVFPGDTYNECVKTTATDNCFKAGDTRVNIQPGLASMHTLFVMEHNRIAAIIAKQVKNSARFWNSGLTEDEFIYQETRKIIGAIVQQITYNEFLPVLLGPQNMENYGLTLEKNKSVKGRYNRSEQATVRSEFSTFAMRVGHTLIPEGVLPMKDTFEPHGSMNHFQEIFSRPSMVYKNGISELLRGISAKPAKDPRFDVISDLDKLFVRNKKTLGGIDLIAFNLQRGRDHGIPGYVEIRRFCKLSVPQSFEELEMLPETRVKLSKVYESVKDIDAWTGAVSELRVPGALVGPVNSCILGNQYKSIKYGDRFYYEFQEPNVKFSDKQLAEIYKHSLARVLCDSADIVAVQPMVMYLPEWDNSSNKRESCKDIPGADFSNWLNI